MQNWERVSLLRECQAHRSNASKLTFFDRDRGVSGGAAWPSMQGALADSVNTHISFLIPLIGFIPLCLYGLGMWVTRCQKYNGGLTIWKMAVSSQGDTTRFRRC